jgi:hypothetical protein
MIPIRFAYKIKFGKSNIEDRLQIWKNKTPSLAKPIALKLAQTYDLSGGHIDNIVRKFITHNILKGKTPPCSRSRLGAWKRASHKKSKKLDINFNFTQ